MKEKTTSDAQLKANKNWQEKNKEHANYLKSRSAARSFIKKKATLEDLEELEIAIKQRKTEIISLDNSLEWKISGHFFILCINCWRFHKDMLLYIQELNKF